MEQKEFAVILAQALSNVASCHSQSYPQGGDTAWGKVGASYLAFALCSLPSQVLRTVQYQAKEDYGPVILNCKWYDSLKAECLGGKKSIQTILPGPDGTLREATVTDELFLEMLDFCREG